MKYLPDKFPIRYAVVIKNISEEEMLPNEKNWNEVLFRQLVNIIQKEPIDKNLLQIKSGGIRVRYKNIEILNIQKLRVDPDWIEKTQNAIKEILPEKEYCYDSFLSCRPFTLGLYNYEATSEIPAFFKAHKSLERDFFRKIFGVSEISRSVIERLYSIFQKIKNGKIKDWELYQELGEFEKPLYINSYYSSLWDNLYKESKTIERREEIGVIPNRIDLPEKIKGFKKDDIKQKKKKIPLVLCKNWYDLFAEEIRVLYKMYNFCNNCGKALPFNYQGSYCPDTKENQQCIKERARVRAKKTRKKSQK